MPRDLPAEVLEDGNLEQRRPPYVVDLCSGVGCPVSRALSRCGWRNWATGNRLPREQATDVTDPGVADKVRAKVALTQVAWIATACATTTLAREIPIPGHPDPPQPLRSGDEPWGVAARELSELEKRQLEERNVIIQLGFECAGIVAASEAIGGMEPPRNCHLWAHNEAEQMLATGWMDRDY